MLTVGCGAPSDNADTAALEARIAELEAERDTTTPVTAAPVTTTVVPGSTADGEPLPRACYAFANDWAEATGAQSASSEAVLDARAAALDAGEDRDRHATDLNMGRYMAAMNATTAAHGRLLAHTVAARELLADALARTATDLSECGLSEYARPAVRGADETIAAIAEWCELVTPDVAPPGVRACPPEALRILEADYPPIPD